MSDELPVDPQARIAGLLAQGAGEPPARLVVGPPRKAASATEATEEQPPSYEPPLRALEERSPTPPDAALLAQVTTDPSTLLRPADKLAAPASDAAPVSSLTTFPPATSPPEVPPLASTRDTSPPHQPLRSVASFEASPGRRQRPAGIVSHRQRGVGIYLPAHLRSRVEEFRLREGVSRGALLVEAFTRSYQEVLDTYAPSPKPETPFGPPPRARRSVDDGATVVFYVPPEALDAMNSVAEQLDVSLSQAASLVLERYLGQFSRLARGH